MKFHAVVNVNGKDQVFIVEADSEMDAQSMILLDINRSIYFKSCSPWLPNQAFVIPREDGVDVKE